MAQYDQDFSAAAFSGQLSGHDENRTETWINSEGASIPAGVGMVYEAAGTAELADSASKPLVGIVVHSHAKYRETLTGTLAYENGDTLTLLTEGSIYVLPEETVAAGDDVYCRIESDGGSNTQLGRFRNDSDSGRCKRVRGARFVKAGTTTSPAELYFSASAESMPGEPMMFQVDHASATADTTIKLFKVPAGKHFVLDSAEYKNVNGLAADASNYFDLQIKNGAALMANKSSAAAAHTADTIEAFTAGAAADRVAKPAAQIDLVLDETGTATLPAGTVTIFGRFI